MRRFDTARETPAHDFLKMVLDAGERSGMMPNEMNTTIANILTTNSPLLNLNAGQTLAILALAGLGAFYAGRLTVRVIRFFNGLRAS